MSQEKLFVYGTLQPGGPNEHVLADLGGEWQPGVLRGRLFEAGWGAGMGYPALVLDEDGDEVQGQVLHASGLTSKWAELDEFEGEEYERVEASVTLHSGERVQAQVYVLRGG